MPSIPWDGVLLLEYTDENRGSIQYPDRARQLLDFSGLKYGRITPSDIDGVIEYQDRAYIFYEAKYDGAPMSYGQRLLYKRLADDLKNKCGKPVIVMVCDHSQGDTSIAVNLAEAQVREAYIKGAWSAPNPKMTGEPWTVREITDWFLRTYCGYKAEPYSIE